MVKRLCYQVFCGEVKPLWERCVTSVATYCLRHGIHHLVQKTPILRIKPKASARSENALRLGYLPIFEKFQSFALLHEYDEILVLDSDVWIRPNAPDIFDAVPKGIDFAAVVEPRMPLTKAYLAKTARYAGMQFGDPSFPYYNCGVRVIRRSLLRYMEGQTPAEFIHRPEFAKYVNGEGHHRWATEQVLLNRWVHDSGMDHCALPWEWNALYGGVEPSRLPEASFVHFFLSDLLPHDNIAELLAHPELVARR